MEVAIKFSGDQGIVIQLDNPNTPQYNKLRGFNCQWLSRYKEEDERLFFGGYYRIKIESIRIRRTRQNFQTFIYSLWCFDTMITGGWPPEKVSDDEVFIIDSLMNTISSKPKAPQSGSLQNAKNVEKKLETEKFDDYVYSTFDCFVQN